MDQPKAANQPQDEQPETQQVDAQGPANQEPQEPTQPAPEPKPTLAPKQTQANKVQEQTPGTQTAPELSWDEQLRVRAQQKLDRLEETDTSNVVTNYQQMYSPRDTNE